MKKCASSTWKFHHHHLNDNNLQSSFTIVTVTVGGMAVTRLVFTDSKRNASSFSRTASSMRVMKTQEEKLDIKAKVRFCDTGM